MPTVVQTRVNTNVGDGFSPATIAFTSNVVAGNLLVVMIGSQVGSFSTVTDSLGSTWHLAIADITGVIPCRIYYASAAASGACTVSMGPSPLVSVELMEISRNTPRP